MSAERERVIVARTKLQCASRLVAEATRELFLTALDEKHPLVEAVDDLNCGAQRAVHLADQTLKRYP